MRRRFGGGTAPAQTARDRSDEKPPARTAQCDTLGCLPPQHFFRRPGRCHADTAGGLSPRTRGQRCGAVNSGTYRRCSTAFRPGRRERGCRVRRGRGTATAADASRAQRGDGPAGDARRCDAALRADPGIPGVVMMRETDPGETSPAENPNHPLHPPRASSRPRCPEYRHRCPPVPRTHPPERQPQRPQHRPR